ncbi:MAG: histidinol dehydrogenase, partial [Chloroflexi bacterium]|nr:histidinol dehydrogenase [Chloroflexota bacterium]
RLAAERIRAFHAKQVRHSWIEFEGGTALGQLVRPLARVGLYAPGGRAAYPSTVLMTAVPARVAGVGEVVLATPPARDGAVSPAVLVAADIAGVDRVFRMGGAQAIAALAYGTASVPRVDKLFGPGNIFVTLAKREVFGVVGIDQLAGPSEALLLADKSADADTLAAELLTQAEHDPQATALLLTDSRAQAEAVDAAVERQLAALPRRAIIAEALERQGGVVVVPDLAVGMALANEFAPEHFCLFVADPWALLGQVRNAGAVFVGAQSPHVMGDYVAGPSHVLPTGGAARFASPLHVGDFVKLSSVLAVGPADVARLGPAAMAIGGAEGLDAHVAAIARRLAPSSAQTDG